LCRLASAKTRTSGVSTRCFYQKPDFQLSGADNLGNDQVIAPIVAELRDFRGGIVRVDQDRLMRFQQPGEHRWNVARHCQDASPVRQKCLRESGSGTALRQSIALPTTARAICISLPEEIIVIRQCRRRRRERH
jgi:hypothetical protein